MITNKVMAALLKQARTNRGNSNFGAASLRLKTGETVSVSSHICYVGGMRTTKLTERVDWSVNGVRRSAKKVEAMSLQLSEVL